MTIKSSDSGLSHAAYDDNHISRSTDAWLTSVMSVFPRMSPSQGSCFPMSLQSSFEAHNQSSGHQSAQLSTSCNSKVPNTSGTHSCFCWEPPYYNNIPGHSLIPFRSPTNVTSPERSAVNTKLNPS